MPASCVVPKCGDNGAFGFPADPALNLKWRVAIKRLGPDKKTLWKPTPHSKVCANHFAREDFKVPVDSIAHFTGKTRRMLKEGVVPSIFPSSRPDQNVKVELEDKEEFEFEQETILPDLNLREAAADGDKAGLVGAEVPMLSVDHYRPKKGFSTMRQDLLECQKRHDKRRAEIYMMYTAQTEGTPEEKKKKIVRLLKEAKEEYEEERREIKQAAELLAEENPPQPEKKQPLRREFQRSHHITEEIILCRLCRSTFPNRSLWYSHYSKCPSIYHFICPEPGCEYVSEERQSINRHIISDHMSEENKNASPKLFFCPTCAKNLELKSKESFEQHLKLCYHLNIEDSELTHDPAPQQVSEATLSDGFVLRRTRSTGMNTYECNYCTRQVYSRIDKNGLRYHLSKFHNFLEEDTALPSKEKKSVTNDDIINTSGAAEDAEEIKCHLCEFSISDTEPSHPMNNGRQRMTQHYSMTHNIPYMRLCEKRGCNFRSANRKLNRKHRREEAGHSQCEICGRQILAVNLELHKKMVHGDTTFDCEYCDRPYGNKGMLKRHLFKHHGREAYGKFVEKIHKKCKMKVPGICQVCGEYVDDQRVHLMAWHPDISAPGAWKSDLTKGIRKLTKKPRWAERVNKRQKVLSEQGKLPPNSDQMETSKTIQ